MPGSSSCSRPTTAPCRWPIRSRCKGEKEVTDNPRYKTGRNLRRHDEVFAVDDPEAFGLPKAHLSSRYIFATERDFMVYPNNLSRFVRYLDGTFQHGGISMEEMLVPLVTSFRDEHGSTHQGLGFGPVRTEGPRGGRSVGRAVGMGRSSPCRPRWNRKTTLVAALARHHGSADAASSPTFALCQELSRGVRRALAPPDSAPGFVPHSPRGRAAGPRVGRAHARCPCVDVCRMAGARSGPFPDHTRLLRMECLPDGMRMATLWQRESA